MSSDEVGATETARAFYAGRYGEIVAASYDVQADIAPADVAFVVGALAFLGRIDDASACLDIAGSSDPRTIAAARFFVGVAYARAGDFDRSIPELVAHGFRSRHHVDPWVRAFAFQGLACQCYFTGRFPGAARHALRALHAAHEAKSVYVTMLATDMRGHSLVQQGQLQRGIAMLEQANQQASRLGLANNAFAVEASIAQYTARFVPTTVALERLETLRRRRAHDSYSQRALSTEVAVQRALRGHRTAAIEALEDAERDALRGDTRRGKISSLLARLWVTRWQLGPAACADLVEQARQLVEPRDVAYQAELLGFEILVARHRGDDATVQRALDDVHHLDRRSHHVAARAVLGQYVVDRRTTPFDEDAVTPVLRAVAQRDAGALSRIVALGLVGVIPELLGLTPARRIILLPSEGLLLLEDHGDIIVRERPPRWCPHLLRLLASGDASKERIVAGMWGLRAYHPDLHDPPVRTTIHRLRSFLQPHADWIESIDNGYRTAVPVHLVTAGEPTGEPAPLWDEGEIPTLESPAERRAVGAVSSLDHRHDLEDTAHMVYRRLGEIEQATVPQLARSLALSPSTVLRALRTLVDLHQVERLGFARATRYRVTESRRS